MASLVVGPADLARPRVSPLARIGERWLAPGDTVPIASLSALSAVATLGSPVLLAHPLLLVALTPRLPFLVLAAGDTPLLLVVAVAVPRLCAADVFWFRIGRRVGPRALDRLPGRLQNLLARAPRAQAAVLGAAILIRPVGRHLAAGAAAGMSARTVALLDVAGTLVFVLAVHLGAHAVLG